MFRFYFSILLVVVSLVNFNNVFAQKKQKNAPTVQKNSEIKAEYLFIKGEDYFIQQNYEKALTFFFDAEHNSPRNATLQYKIGECYFLLGNKEKALAFAKKAIHLDKTEKAFYLLLSTIYLNDKDYSTATKVYEDLIKNIKNPDIYYLDLAHITQQMLVNELQKYEVRKTKNGEKNIEELSQKTLDAYSHFEKTHGYDVNITQQKQKLWMLLNKTNEAFEEGEAFLEKNPEHINFILSQSQLLYTHKNPQAAIDYLEKKEKDNPNNLEIQLTLVEYYNANNQEAKATDLIHSIIENDVLSIDKKISIITFYLQREKGTTYQKLLYELSEKIMTQHDDEAKSFALSGDVYYKYKDIEKAQKSYLKAVEIEKTHPLIWQQIIFIDTEKKDYDNLILHCNEAVKAIPDNATFWLYKGIAHSMKKEKENAILAFEEGLKYSKSNGTLSQKFYAQLGDLYNDVKAYDKSFTAYEKALEYDPNNAHVLNNYSYFSSLRKTNLQKAKSMSSHLTRMFPNEATYLDTQAWVLYMLKEYKEAKKILQRALEFSEDGTIIEHYGDVLFQLGDKENALIQWKKAKEKGGTSDLINKKISDEILYEE